VTTVPDQVSLLFSRLTELAAADGAVPEDGYYHVRFDLGGESA
jgi:hypothetical protein